MQWKCNSNLVLRPLLGLWAQRKSEVIRPFKGPCNSCNKRVPEAVDMVWNVVFIWIYEDTCATLYYWICSSCLQIDVYVYIYIYIHSSAHVHLTLQIERAGYQNRMWCKMRKVGDLLLSNLVNPQVMTLFELVLSNCWIFVNHQNQLPREFTWHVVAGSRHCHSCHREQYGQKSKAISWGFVKVWFHNDSEWCMIKKTQLVFAKVFRPKYMYTIIISIYVYTCLFWWLMLPVHPEH